MSDNKKVKIAQFDKSGKIIARYMSLSEASTRTGVQVAHIGKVANGKRLSAGGFVWKHVTGNMDKLNRTTRGIRQTTKDGITVAIFSDADTAASMVKGVTAKRIITAITSDKIVAGYLWS